MSPPFEWLSGQNCSLCESSLVVAQGKMHLGEVFGSIRAALFVLRQFAADVGTLAPGNGWLRDASHCVIGEHPMLPWLALTFTAARLGFEAQNAAVFRLMRLGSRLETAAGDIIPHAAALPQQAPALAAAVPKKRPAANTSKKSAPAKRQRKRSKGR
jgi:hypothetical protein